MWEFISGHPWTFVAGGLILIAAIAGVVYGVLTRGGWEDRGFMVTDDGKHPLKWLRTSFPITCIVHPQVPLMWRATYTAAAKRINQAVGAELFDPLAQDAPPGYRLDGPVPPGFLFLCSAEPAGELQPDHGTTRLKWGKADGRIFSAVVTVPTDTIQRAAVMLHELGHVLGLDHDEIWTSIMYPRLSARAAPGELSEEDIKRLKGAYS